MAMHPFLIKDFFNDQTITLSNGDVWKIENKLSERYQEEDEPYEAVAVYNSTQVVGPMVGLQAIVKLKMQILDESQMSPNPTERAEYATEELHVNTQDEIHFLSLLTDLECSSSPKMITWSQRKQSDDMWVPGGYIVFILMEKLPGITIKEKEFWETYSLEKREEIRSAFKDALMEIRGHRVSHMDASLRNFLWDESQKKCYIIDLKIA